MATIKITESQYNRLFRPKQNNIIISEQQYNRLFSLITESKQSKNISKARKTVEALSPGSNPQQIIDAIRHDIPNSRLNDCKYLAGVTRMYLNNELYDYETIGKLRTVKDLISVIEKEKIH